MIANILPILITFQTGSAELELSLPIECELGTECVIQQYVDHDPGPGALDHQCGRQTYDGHKGTDFRLPDLEAMNSGVEVLASASGRVINIRDGEPDLFASDRQPTMLEGKECGNGIVLDHGDGWQTQYCHLKKGSIRVRSGAEIEAGDTLGLVGMSGKAAFPHLHLSVRYKGQVVDPFALDFERSSCDGEYETLWDEEAEQAAGYEDAIILNAGFADAALNNRDIEGGAGRGFTFVNDAPALVLFARMINVIEGDYLRFSIMGPDGFEVKTTSDPAPRPQAQRMAYAGKKRAKTGWPDGEYRAQIELVREGSILERRELTIIKE